MAKKILVNKARCKLCGDVVESKHRHDFRSCSCGAMSVDGGREYIRRAWSGERSYYDTVEDLNVYEELSPTDKGN